MKIWCDVCSSKEASVFCSADEASLCLDCDPKVHQANKLASKHQRFSLLKPTSSDFPLCDICQEKKALLFCQQDRAILCRDCDISIHASNEYTQKHNRYLLTGIKLSPSSASNLPVATVSSCTNTKQMSKDGTGGSSSNNNGGFDQVPDFKSDKSNSTKKIVPSYTSSANYSEISSTLTNEVNNNKSQRPAPNVKSTTASKDGSIIQLISNSGSGGNNSDGSTTSSISEYLIEMLPGWQVEDLLQDSSSVPFSYSKIQDNSFLGIDLLPNKDDERDRSFENMGLWVPQAPSPLLPLQPSTPFSTNIEFGMNHGFIQNHHQTAKGENNKKPSSRKKMIMNNNAHDGFMVPQLSPQFLSGSNKRSRPFY